MDGIVDGDLSSRTDRVIQNDRTWSYVLHSPENDEAPIVVTQNDIRQIQLAKAALYAGVKLLMDHIGTETVRANSSRRCLWQPYQCAACYGAWG